MNENHTAGLLTTIILHAVVLFVMIVPASLLGLGKLGCGAGDSEATPKLNDDVMMIEAQIAYLKEDAPKQPQKKRTEKRVEKREGISRDENKQVEDKKKPEDKTKPPPDWRDFERDTEEEYDPDLEEGKAPPRQGGAFDGEKFGWAETNKGHPYLRDLAKDMIAEVPTLVRGDGVTASACIRLRADGTVAEEKVREKSGNATVDRAADEALRKLSEKRKDPADVKPVPAELIDITTKWLCFKIGT